ncbi:hypothetical protein FZEAL_3626 [Fusarium zealandicum]|uniref:WW domain-containing protein n=1 Tax=Fusarium zealandicum TaxID=1053134 RepID=A0A8H4UNB9_9HYPO|nr:hypothetical protein FZEAL_3626 [Fusarium zealandicum]
MSFLNKFKKEFEGLSLSDRLQGQQQEVPSSLSNSYQYQPHSSNHYPDQHQGPQSYQSNSQQPHYGAQQPYNPGHQQQNLGYQPYNGQQSYPGQHPYDPQITPGCSASSQRLQQPQHQQPPLSSPGPISSPSSGPFVPYPPEAAALTAYGTPGGQSIHVCPTAPRWIPHWSEHDRQWYYVETTGRSSWEAPSNLPPLLSMPAYTGSLNSTIKGQGDQNIALLSQPEQARPGLKMEEKMSSSQAILAAAGGFAAGGIAGYLVKDRIDKRKTKKRHGRSPDDFVDFTEYPDYEVGLDCNVCDQEIRGPYAHCKKCDGGDYDICRDCISQGQTCDGDGKHSLVKAYPTCYCDICDQTIRGRFYHCIICKEGNWDTCQRCFDKGWTCSAPDRGEEHDLSRLYIPDAKSGKNGKASDSDSDSSDSD